MPYFPYSRQSKKKSHRGAITARMIANLLHVAGVDHVITIDLHSSQMQGFFKCPVDNLVAEPLLANWIQRNVPDWREGVVVSKNPGGTRRVTSLADALELNFALVTTDRRRMVHSSSLDGNPSVFDRLEEARRRQEEEEEKEERYGPTAEDSQPQSAESDRTPTSPKSYLNRRRAISNDLRRRAQTPRDITSSPLVKSARTGDVSDIPAPPPLSRSRTDPPLAASEKNEEEYTDEVMLCTEKNLSNIATNIL
jgi:ribose-phosphate pyrophosphokinase